MTALVDPGERAQRLGAVASSLIRQWLGQDEAAVVAAIGAIGRAAVEQSGVELARLDPATSGGSAALSALDDIAAALDAPSPAPGGWFGRAAPPAAKPSLTELAGLIEAERDAALRQVLMLKTDRARLAAADAALDDAVALAALIEPLLKSAAREIAGDDPARAASLRGEIALRLAERQRDLLMQQTVVRQAMHTIDLLADGQATLIEALERARTLSVGAVRAAIAARRAVQAAGAIDRRR